MELHALDRQGFVAHAHDFVDVAVRGLGPGGDVQAIRGGGFVDDQGMIAHHGEGAGQAGEYALPPVVDLGGLTVHDVPGADDVSAEGLADALVAQADAQDRDLAGETFDGGQRDARFIGGAGTR